MPTATLEEYLETVYKLSLRGCVKPSQIAEAAGVSGATVTATLHRLEGQGLITRTGTAVVLTAEGTARALDIVRRHRVAEAFLVNTLGMDWGVAHEDACLLEHALSPRVLEALERFLQNPESCPHGHPIPSADGRVTTVPGLLLSEAESGSRVTVLRVDESNDELLGYLGELGLTPGTSVLVSERAPFNGPLSIDIGGKRIALSCEVAGLVTVESRDTAHASSEGSSAAE
ncbi:MAG: metal-dependent transcriptional regulator [Coriobacteriia bacterium]|nr:metal-dependent transcriptional regulator [Coriobacteriia bacterium]